MKSATRASLTLASLFAVPAALAQHADLEEVVVTASPLRASALDLAQSAIVLAGDDLSRRISSSLGETLASQPGLTASFFGPRASRPIIRGLAGERVLMLQNGVSALDVSNLSPDHSVGIEEILADQVEVLKGPSTLVFGSGAVGGVVNVVDGRIPARGPEGWSGVAELRAESVDEELSGAARLDGRTGTLGFHAHGYYRETDDYDIPGYAWSRAARTDAIEDGEEPDLTRGTVENSDSETRGGALGASWFGDGVTVGLSWGRHETDYGLPGPGGHAHEHADEPAAAAAEEEEAVRIDQRQDRFDLQAEWSDLGGLVEKVLLRAAYNDYRHDELEGTEIGTRFDQTGIDTRLHLDHAAVAGWAGTLGLQYTDSDLEARGDEAYVPPSQTRSFAAFLVERQRFDRLTVDLGARLERQEIDTEAAARDYGDTALTLAGGLLWAFDDALTGAVHLTRSERHPQAAELYADGPHLAVARYEIGDDGLRSEVANTIDLGLRGEGDLHWHLSIYYSDFGDYIYTEPTGTEEDGLPVYRYVQRDAEFYGIEAEVEFPLARFAGGDLHGRLGGDYVRGRLSQGGDLPQIPPLRLLGALEYDLGQFHAAVDVQWFDEQSKTARDELPTDGGTLLGAEVSWLVDEWQPNLLVFLRGTNLLDEEMRRHSSPLKEYVPLPGASVLLGVRATF
jgi:iron complex outermembrane receptor protein